MAKSLLTPLGWSFVTEHPPAPALGKAEEKTFPAERSVQPPGFVMCHHTKQTKNPPHQEHPCPPSVFQAFSVCKSQFIQVPAAFCWAAPPLQGLQRPSEVLVALEVLAPTGAQTAAPGGGLNPGKLGYGKGQFGWSKITPPTSQQHLCCSKCSLHHHKLLLLSKYYTLVLCASKILL